MTVLTKEIQLQFIEENFNKPVIYSSIIGRLAGYIETKHGYANVISFGFGHKEPFVYIDAGLNLTFIEQDNTLFKSVNQLLSLNGNPEIETYFFQDLSKDVLFNTYGLEYLKHHSLSFFNKLVQIDNDIVRMIGYCADDFGNSYVCLNINNEKKYFDSLCQVRETKISDALRVHLEDKINKVETLVFENLQSEE